MAGSKELGYMIAGAAVSTGAYLLLADIAEKQGVTVSELVRQALYGTYPDVAAKAEPIAKPGRKPGYSPKKRAVA